MCDNLLLFKGSCADSPTEHKADEGVELFPSFAFLGRSYAVFRCGEPELFSRDLLDMCPLLFAGLGICGAIAVDASFSRAICGRGVSEDVATAILKLLKET